MRIFLSYASEDRAIAEAVRLALASDDHSVFFDREDLPAGGEFHTRIRRGIERSDLMIFLLSAKSIDAGSYTLTEASIAEKTWPTPDGRVLPVLLEPMKIADLPAYLRSVTLLETPGNVPADVAVAVERIGRERRRKRLRIIAPIAAACFLAVGASTWFLLGRGTPQVRTGKDGAAAVLVPAGTFKMGDDVSSPVRQPFVDAFYMDRFETTVGNYRKFLESTRAAQAPDYWDALVGEGSDQKPVIGVSWNDAKAYCSWAGKRLPTETEWEKAARGADGRTYPWGESEPSVELTNYLNSSPDPYDGALSPVGAHPAGKSPYGIEDLAGNAAEWVADWYSESFSADDLVNPRGPDHGEGRVIRGGGRYDPGPHLASASRQYASPDTRSDDTGFRCASDP